MRRSVKKIFFNNHFDNYEDILVVLKEGYNEVCEEIFEGLFQLIRETSSKERINTYLNKISYIVDNEEDIDNLKLLSKRLRGLIKQLCNCKLKGNYLIDTLTMMDNNLDDKINYYSKIDIYQLGYYLIFRDKSLERLSSFINDNKDLLLLKNDHHEDLFYQLLVKLCSCDNDDENISYYQHVIDLFLTSDNYDLILSNRLFYLTLLQLPNNYSKSHVVDAIEKLQKFYKVPIEQLEEKYDVHFSFPSNVMEKSFGCKPIYTPRVNRLYQTVITIDNGYAKSFDDAVSIEKNDDGTYKLYLHISAIADIVPNNSLIQEEAYHRGKSLYLADNNILMYPSYISHNLCSLKKGNNRNVFTFIFNVDRDFQIIPDSMLIEKSKICVSSQLSYDEADQIMFDEEDNSRLKEMLQILSLISYKLKAQNMAKESYRKIENIFNDDIFHESKITDKSVSANIVQELMILLNSSLAKYFKDNNLPYIYRVHNTDSSDVSVKEINDLLVKHENGIINKLEDKQLESFIKNNYLNARYSPSCQRHEGLNLDTYSHATAPIWRYSDTEIQYLLNDLIFKIPQDSRVYDWEDRVKRDCTYLNYRNITNSSFKQEYDFLIDRGLIRKKVRK